MVTDVRLAPRVLQTGKIIRVADRIGRLRLKEGLQPGEVVAYVFGAETYFAMHQALATALENERSTVFDDVLGHVQFFSTKEEMDEWANRAESALAGQDVSSIISSVIAPPESRRTERLSNLVAVSDVGKRPNNQDFFIIEKYPDADIAIGADGAGGQLGGEYASQRASEVVHDHLVDHIEAFSTNNDAVIEALIRDAIVLANKAIWEEAAAVASINGMGTTIDVMVRVGRNIYYGHAGDSRIYRIRNGQHIEQITRDDKITRLNTLTRAVGLDGSIDPVVGKVTLEDGEKVLWCSDGLHPGKHEKAFREKMAEEAKKPPLEFANAMVDAGLAYPESDDNTTVIIMEAEKKCEPEQQPTLLG